MSRYIWSNNNNNKKKKDLELEPILFISRLHYSYSNCQAQFALFKQFFFFLFFKLTLIYFYIYNMNNELTIFDINNINSLSFKTKQPINLAAAIE